jgi:hypothetical protein
MKKYPLLGEEMEQNSKNVIFVSIVSPFKLALLNQELDFRVKNDLKGKAVLNICFYIVLFR